MKVTGFSLIALFAAVADAGISRPEVLVSRRCFRLSMIRYGRRIREGIGIPALELIKPLTDTAVAFLSLYFRSVSMLVKTNMGP